MLHVKESWVDRTRNIRCGDSDVYETWCNTTGELYRAMRREYGRCVSRVYVDGPNGTARAIGWVFQRRRKYDDVNETYLAETWVTIHDKPDSVTHTEHFHYLK
jgi:hypothetical protein